jgi:spermidine synthase
VRSGTAALVPDGDGRRGWTVMVNGIPSSHVDLDDPLRLDFEYMRWIGDLLDVAAPDGEPLHTLHLGGAGCTLARYVAATRPASRQLVVEIDPDLVELARQSFGLRSTPGLRLRAGEAREVLTGLPADRYDVVIRDAFDHASVPAQLTTRQFFAEVARVLAPGGIYVSNMGDSPGLDRARTEAATVVTRFRHVIVISEPAQLRGRRYGNVVLAASDAALPVGPLGRRLASGAVRARMLEDDEVRNFSAGRRPLEDPPATEQRP